jgi:Domain of unknown function (DUF4340)
MNEKTLKSIVTTFLVLLVLWGASYGLGSMRKGGPALGAGVSDVLQDLGPATVTGITIQGPTGETTLMASDGDAWTVNGYPADGEALSRVWGALSEVEVGSIVATNPANHARMGVSSDSAWTVAFTTATGAHTILIGKSGSVFSTAYLRLPDQDEVVLITGDLRESLARPPGDWRDKTILTVDTTRIARIVVDRDGGDRTMLLRGDSTWTVAGAPVRQRTITDFMSEVAKITASGFLDEGTDVFTGNDRVLRVEDPEGATLAQIRFVGNGTTQHALLPEGDVIFEIPNWRVERLTPTSAMAKEPDTGG